MISALAVDKAVSTASQFGVGDAADHTQAALALHGVGKSYGEVNVLDGLELELAAGEVALVEGRNGVGKTTLLRIAAGIITADRGLVSAYGLHPERDARAYRRGLGLLSAGDRGLYARLKVRQNLEFWASVAFVPRAQRGAAIDRVIDRFSLEELAGRRADRLSLGQRQRVRLAMAFLHGPRLVLLDEPTTSLDESGVASVSAALADLTERGGAALWCAPSGPRSTLPADRRYVLDRGALEPA